jgi:hypothetical protein
MNQTSFAFDFIQNATYSKKTFEAAEIQQLNNATVPLDIPQIFLNEKKKKFNPQYINY